MSIEEIIDKYFTGQNISNALRSDLIEFAENQAKEIERLKKDKHNAEQNWQIHCDMNIEATKENTQLQKQLEEKDERVKELEKKSQYWCDRYNETTRF